ncbi:MAG TPA: hypothetical protein VGM56_02360 [Byssovorax sp.]
MSQRDIDVALGSACDVAATPVRFPASAVTCYAAREMGTPRSSASAAPPPAEPLGARLGDAGARALGVSLLAALPASLRVAAAGGSVLDGWLVAAGIAVPFVTAALVVAGAAGRGFRYLTARRSPRAVVLGLALWIGLALGPLALLASLLKDTTHHRGLGGATFGALGLLGVVAAALVARRLVELGDRLVARGAPATLVAGVSAVVAVVPMLLAAAPLGGKGGGAGDAAVRAAVLDGAILLVATALAASVEMPERLRALATRVGLPLALVVVVAAGARVTLSSGVVRSVLRGGGLAATALGAFESWAHPADAGTSRLDFDSVKGPSHLAPALPVAPGDLTLIVGESRRGPRDLAHEVEQRHDRGAAEPGDSTRSGT